MSTKDKIEYRDPKSIKPYKKNAKKHPKKQIQQVADSIKEFGFNQPIVVDAKGIIIVGHGRHQAAMLLELKTVPVLELDITEDKAKAYRIADNKLNESAWDNSLLYAELKDLTLPSLELTGFTLEDIKKNSKEYLDGQKDALRERYIIPPFSIFDTKQAYWQKRKKQWLEIVGDSGEGRDDNLLTEGMKQLAQVGKGSSTLTGTSVFDPVLCEIAYRWFNIEDGRVLDPFAGGSTRGLVASILGYPYTGIDLSSDQIKANEEQAKKIGEAPRWIHGNSIDVEDLVGDGEYDFMFSCPPYYDLEQYTKNPEDLSNLARYEDFIGEYREIIKRSVDKLKNNRFAVFVVGDIRDKKGYYRGFIADTIQAFNDAGMEHYNDIILVNAIATASLRAKTSFEKNRKVVKVHQNILVFTKGSPEQVKDAYAQLPRIERHHNNVIVFYKGDIEEIRKNYKIVNTNFDYMKMGLDD